MKLNRLQSPKHYKEGAHRSAFALNKLRFLLVLASSFISSSPCNSNIFSFHFLLVSWPLHGERCFRNDFYVSDYNCTLYCHKILLRSLLSLMESESEIHPHSPHPNTHVNLHLQHSCGLLTLIPSVRQDQTPPIGAPETKKKNRRVLRTARQRRLQRIKISTRVRRTINSFTLLVS